MVALACALVIEGRVWVGTRWKGAGGGTCAFLEAVSGRALSIVAARIRDGRGGWPVRRRPVLRRPGLVGRGGV